MESAFFETRRAAELLQQFSGVLFVGTMYFCSLLSIGSLPCTIPVPALRPCLTYTAFASALVRSAASTWWQCHGIASLVSILSGDGYSLFKELGLYSETIFALTNGFMGDRLTVS